MLTRRYLQRAFADIKKPSLNDSKPIVLPGSASDATSEPLPPGAVKTSPSSSVSVPRPTPATPTSSESMPMAQIPLTPPEPPAAKVQTSPPTTIGSNPNTNISTPPQPPNSPPPPPPGRQPRRFFRKLFTRLALLSVLGFGGGVYYSRINDNFHDIFTEFVPFGEEAVGYLEERDFRKRFPQTVKPRGPRDTGNSVKIPSQSGVSWRVAQEEKRTTTPQLSEAKQMPSEAKHEDKVKAVEQVKKEAGTPAAKAAPVPTPTPAPAPPAAAPLTAKPVPEPATSAKSANAATEKGPEVDEPSRFPSKSTAIDPINIKGANEPLVQDLVKIVNDIITVVNADNANDKFSSTIGKAKGELQKVGSRILALKQEAAGEAEKKVQTAHDDFDRAAKELVRRLEAEMHEQEARWKEDYEQERQKIQQSYEQKLQTEIKQAEEINKQILNNKLLEQAVELKRTFVSDVKDKVEEERNSRLGKLSDLSNTVSELEKLTTDWNSVVDANLKTQHLHVAVEAVRANLEKASMPRPFIRELAALKEIGADDPVVNAAIASINPTAYQRGVPSAAHLIDRFRRVATEVRKASLLPAEAGVASHASSYVLSKLLFKKKGLATGTDVESILTRTETYLEEGDLDAAAREMNGLQGWAKTLSKDWLGEVRKVLEVQQALDVSSHNARTLALRWSANVTR